MYDIILGRDEGDKKLLGEKGLIFIGKGYVKMGQYTSLSNKIFMDVARSHVVLVAGKRGSGKSYTLGVIAEEISNLPKEVSQNLACLIFDTMGIYWTMKFGNEKDRKLLQDWGLKSKNLPVKVFVPSGHFESYLERGIPIDDKFALNIKELTPEDWLVTFGLDITNPVSILIQRTLSKLKEQENFDISDIISLIEKDEKTQTEIKNSAVGLFEAAEEWGIFAKGSEEATEIKDLINAGTTSVLDLSITILSAHLI
jgi:ABC-type dipeptide/oligopeptide/nickel transport system ATPase component